VCVVEQPVLHVLCVDDCIYILHANGVVVVTPDSCLQATDKIDSQALPFGKQRAVKSAFLVADERFLCALDSDRNISFRSTSAASSVAWLRFAAKTLAHEALCRLVRSRLVIGSPSSFSVWSLNEAHFSGTPTKASIAVCLIDVHMPDDSVFWQLELSKCVVAARSKEGVHCWW
jgi:hypothetical protein